SALEEGEGVQRPPLAGVMPFEAPAGDSCRITGASRAVDALAAGVQPGPELGKTFAHGSGEPPLGIRSDADEVIPAPGDDLQQTAQDLLDGLGGIVPARRAPGARHRDARFPRVARILRGQGLLRRAVVLVRAMDLAVHDEDVRLQLAGALGDPVDAD